MADKLVEIFKSFLSGNQDSYWEFICNERVQKVIDYQISITRSKFKLSKEEVDDFRNEMFISLDRRLRAYVFDPAKDDEHQANSIFNYMQLVLIGESDKVAKIVKGMISIDSKGCSTIKGYKYSLESTVKNDDGDSDHNEIIPKSRISYIGSSEKDEEISKYFNIRKALYNYLSKRGDIKLYRAMVMHYDDGVSWNEVAERLNLKTTEKQSYARESEGIISLFRAVLVKESQMKIKAYILGIFTNQSNVSMCIIDMETFRILWTFDYFTQSDLTTIEGKISDWIRQYDLTFAVMNAPMYENEANVLIKRILSRRNILCEFLDLEYMIARIQNMDSLKEKTNWTDYQCYSWILANSKRQEIKIARTKSSLKN